MIYYNEISKMEELINYCSLCLEKDRGITIHISNKEVEGLEMCVNPVQNINYKRDYYQTAYNEDLTLKANPDIKIIGTGLIY